MRHGGQVLVSCLEAQGVSHVFTVPGESFLAVLDGLYDSSRIRTVVCRQEGGAAMMADAWGKLTGQPGICFATRGPGAANAMAGIHIAQQDSTPMILFLGLPPKRLEDREAFQEIDVRRMFTPAAKWAGVVRSAQRIPEYVSRAFTLARSGRPGPVVLGVPEDVLTARLEISDALPVNIAHSAPRAEDIEAMTRALSAARRPIMIVGGPGWSAEISRSIMDFAQRWHLPTVAAFRYQDYIDNRHPCYVGHAGIGMEAHVAAAIRAADLLLVVGARLGEITTAGYTIIDSPNPRQALIHVHPDPDELGSVYAPEIAIAATSASFARELGNLAPATRPAWAAGLPGLRESWEASLAPRAMPGAINFGAIIRQLSDALPADAIVTNGAGNYAAFLHKHFVYKGYRTQLSPTSGSMGYGLPAAIAAKLAHPERAVVCLAGDGCLMMTVQELATAVQHDTPIVIVVANNSSFGTIRMHQEKNYPRRVSATDLRNPDFPALARSFGAHGERVARMEDFAPAIKRALAMKVPALIELLVDTDAISPRHTITELRGSAAR